MQESKDYISGYEEGQQRAKEGTSRNRWSWRRLIAYIFSNSFDEFIDGVNQGYLDELKKQYKDVTFNKVYIEPEQRERWRKALQNKIMRVKNETNKNNVNTITNINMSYENSFENQIRLLNLLKTNLLKMNDMLRTTTSKYNQNIEELHSAGMFKEPYEKMRNQYMSQTNAMIENIVNEVENRDISTINKIIAKLEPLIH